MSEKTWQKSLIDSSNMLVPAKVAFMIASQADKNRDEVVRQETIINDLLKLINQIVESSDTPIEVLKKHEAGNGLVGFNKSQGKWGIK